jgi:hypothetical protein
MGKCKCVDQIVYAKFSRKLHVGDVVTYDMSLKEGQFFLVKEIIPSCRGYEVENYELGLITNDPNENPETLPFKIGTPWRLNSVGTNKKFRVVSKRKQYYD